MYQLNEEGVSEEATEEDDDVVACAQWVLPNREFDGLWPSLIYDAAIKTQLLEYATTAMLFAACRLDLGWSCRE